MRALLLFVWWLILTLLHLLQLLQLLLLLLLLKPAVEMAAPAVWVAPAALSSTWPCSPCGSIGPCMLVLQEVLLSGPLLRLLSAVEAVVFLSRLPRLPRLPRLLRQPLLLLHVLFRLRVMSGRVGLRLPHCMPPPLPGHACICKQRLRQLQRFHLLMSFKHVWLNSCLVLGLSVSRSVCTPQPHCQSNLLGSNRCRQAFLHLVQHDLGPVHGRACQPGASGHAGATCRCPWVSLRQCQTARRRIVVR